jgi:NADH:ubiquinone oxidoreductase subunit E
MENIFEDIVTKYRKREGNVIFLLQETQEAFGYIPREAIDFFSSELNIAPSRFYGVATFYSQFRFKPTGKNKIVACCGTACHVRGSEKILNAMMRELQLTEDEETTKDMEFTLEKVNCVGACSIAPVFLINKKVYGKSTPEKIIKEVRSMRGVKQDDA